MKTVILWESVLTALILLIFLTIEWVQVPSF